MVVARRVRAAPDSPGRLSLVSDSSVARAQLWQWIRHGATLDDGRGVTPALLDEVLAEELDVIATEIGRERMAGGRFDEASRLFHQLAASGVLEEFLTLSAYELRFGETP